MTVRELIAALEALPEEQKDLAVVTGEMENFEISKLDRQETVYWSGKNWFEKNWFERPAIVLL